VTRVKASAVQAALATLGLAGAAWIIALRLMSVAGMGGMAETAGASMPEMSMTTLGSFPSFVALWTLMMAAMMLPAAVPAVLRSAEASGRARSVPLFIGSYLIVWTLVGVVVYALYRPMEAALAGAIVIAAGVYELTPLKRHFRRLCRDGNCPGWQFGLYCVGSSIGLMLMLVALGIMSVIWMAVISIVVLAQKLLPPKAAIDVPVALVIGALGVLIVITQGRIL
jgi:predicted metal-binding membrane protein